MFCGWSIIAINQAERQTEKQFPLAFNKPMYLFLLFLSLMSPVCLPLHHSSYMQYFSSVYLYPFCIFVSTVCLFICIFILHCMSGYYRAVCQILLDDFSLSASRVYRILRRRMETEAKANSRRCFWGENGRPLRLCSRIIEKGGIS